MKFTEFKEIASYLLEYTKKYWFYKKNLSRYLSMKNITIENISDIEKELLLNLYPATFFEQNDTEEDKITYINHLRVESFYNNHELFMILSKTRPIKEISTSFLDSIFSKTINDSVKNFNKLELEKNLSFVNGKTDNDFKNHVLQKALNNGNLDLLNVIKDSIEWSPANKNLKKIIMKSIMENGSNLKNTIIDEIIRPFVQKEDILQLIKNYVKINKNSEKNLNNFFDTSIVDLVVENNDSIKLDQLSSKKIKKVIKSLNKDSDYSEKIMEYIDYNNSKINMRDKFSLLNSEKLLTHDIWDKLINYKSERFLKAIFSHQEELKNLISSEHLERAVREYKKCMLNTYNYEDKFIDFIKNYPYEITETDISTLIQRDQSNKSYSSSFELEARELIKNKYSNEINLDFQQTTHEDSEIKRFLKNNMDWINILYEKHPQIMNNKDFFLKEIQSSHSNDDFLVTYLNRYFKENPEEEGLRKEIVKRLDIFSSNYTFQKTLEWVINNDLLQELIPKNINTYDKFLMVNKGFNIWVPLLIEKYNVSPDVAIYQSVISYTSNNELFKFILKNYELKPKTQQEICNRVFSINEVELAEEIFKKGIVPNDYYCDKFKSAPTQSGNILLKAQLKKKLEDKIENIHSQERDNNIFPKKIKKI